MHATDFVDSNGYKYKSFEDLITATIESTGCSRKWAREVAIQKGYGAKSFKSIGSITECNQNSGGLAGFADRFDKSKIIPEKIKSGIDNQLKDNGWMYDSDFRKSCAVTVADWRKYADEYNSLQIMVEGNLVWGHPDIIDEMKEIISR